MIYFDHNATTPVRPEVREGMAPYLDHVYGNPSSLHRFGQQARKAVDEAREQVAHLVGADPDEIFFTSGGTEADNWAVNGAAAALEGRVVTTAIEHHAVLHSAEALRHQQREVVIAGVDGRGLVDPESLVSLAGSAAALVSVVHGNNETGAIQPIAAFAAQLRGKGILIHADAVQSAGKVVVSVDDLGVDLLSLSAHKINGPKGTGALYVRRGTSLGPGFLGGGHEGGRRAGTENVAGIVGFGITAELRRRELQGETKRVSLLRQRLESGIIDGIEDVVVNSPPVEQRLSNTLNISFRGVEAEAIILGLDLEGIAVSSGSACSSGEPEPSHVLLAAGIEPRLATSAVRFSLGWGNTAAQVDRVLEVLAALVQRLREVSALPSG